MKTIGVLGGIGPQATMDFERRLHEAAQSTIPPRGNRGYPPLVTLFLRHAPVVVTDEEKPAEPLTLDPRVLDAARYLGQWADFLTIPSNTPHFFLEEISEAAGIPVLSIIDVTVDELRARGIERVGLTGLGIPKVYAERLERESFGVEVASPETRGRLDDAIIRLMEGRATDEHRRAALEAVEELRARQPDATILGCSEIPLLLGEHADAPDLIDPALLLARAAVDHALESDA